MRQALSTAYYGVVATLLSRGQGSLDKASLMFVLDVLNLEFCMEDIPHLQVCVACATRPQFVL